MKHTTYKIISVDDNPVPAWTRLAYTAVLQAQKSGEWRYTAKVFASKAAEFETALVNDYAVVGWWREDKTRPSKP